jgi:hypothetical protein
MDSQTNGLTLAQTIMRRVVSYFQIDDKFYTIGMDVREVKVIKKVSQHKCGNQEEGKSKEDKDGYFYVYKLPTHFNILTDWLRQLAEKEKFGETEGQILDQMSDSIYLLPHCKICGSLVGKTLGNTSTVEVKITP